MRKPSRAFAGGRTEGRAFGLLLGVAADALLADPRRVHPVAGFGSAAGALERAIYADSRFRGAAYVVVCVSGAVGLGFVLRSVTGSRTLAGPLTMGTAAWAVLGGASLAREATAMAAALGSGDLSAARARLPHLCGRDPEALDGAGLVRATVESVAENTADAVVAPLLWGAVAGLPGMLGYRAVNTLDAMVGHRSARYARFGWAAARLDDVATWAPARLTGLLAVALAPLVGGSPRRTYRIYRRDGARHPSPNAGRCEAAFAGALGVRLGGTNSYGGRVEHRPELGNGRAPLPADVRRAVRLSRAVGLAAAGLAAAGLAAAGALTVAAVGGRRG
ncbi:MAG: cobalamin biosynthesis protein [Streptosporangiales bacterium]|nr:cobalamin biosynthesis protein [Streptosporangiales bacterium]